ncbi:MAG TPA: hypothetical protein VF941_10265 [Clostridia bacterium]
MIKKPSVILLLDGFNEITVDKQELLLEIRELISMAKGVQIIVTSRAFERNFHSFNKVELLYLTGNQIDSYIKKLNKSKSNMEKLKGSPLKLIKKPMGDLLKLTRKSGRIPLKLIKKPEGNLLKLVRNPMMLTLYTATCSAWVEDVDNILKKEVETSGELIWNFIQSHVLKKEESCSIKERLYFKFILNHLLTYIGYRMEKLGHFNIKHEKLRVIINQAYEEFNNDNFYNTFPEYEGYGRHLGFGANHIVDTRERFQIILDILTKTLRLMTNGEENSYNFLHQHFRDYFSAVYIINRIKICINAGEIPDVLKERILPPDIRRFIGEIEGEHYTKPKLTEPGYKMEYRGEKNLSLALELCRGVFDKSIGYAVWNIIEIWKYSRGELTGCDLSNLDLYSVRLNGVICSRWYKGFYLAANFDGAKIHDVNILPFGHSSSVDSAVYSNDGRRILTASFDRTIKEWDVSTKKCIHTYSGHSDWVRGAIYSPDSKKILSISRDNTIKEWDINTEKCLHTYKGHTDCVVSALYRSDGKKILSASFDGTIKEWDVKTLDETDEYIEYKGCRGWVRSAVYSPDGSKILSAHYDGTIVEWDLDTNKELHYYIGHLVCVNSAIYSHDGKKILSAGNDNMVREWNVISDEKKEQKECIKYEGHSNWVTCAIYNSDGSKILSASEDSTIKEWNVGDGTLKRTYSGEDNHSSRVNTAVYSPDGKKVLSASWDSTVKEWDTITGECIQTYDGHSYRINSVKFNLHEDRILLSSQDNTIKELDTHTGVCLHTYIGHADWINSAIYNNDGSKILSASADKTIKEWDTDTGKCIREYKGHSDSVNTAIYSKCERKILSSSDDRTIKEWDVDSGKCIRTLSGHMDCVNSAIYSDDQKRILSASDDRTIKEWDVNSGEYILAFECHSNILKNLICKNGNELFSIDRKRILSFSENVIYTKSNDLTELTSYENSSIRSISTECGTHGKRVLSLTKNIIEEWDTKTRERIHTYKGHSNTVIIARYSSDGKKILSLSKDKTIREWDINTEKCIHKYRLPEFELPNEHEGHSCLVRSATYSNDGNKVLSVSWDNTIKEWDKHTKKCIMTYRGHTAWVNSAVYCKDVQKILSTSNDGTIKEWSTSTGKCIKTYNDQAAWVNSAIYSRDGKKILSASDSNIKLWYVASKESIDIHKSIPGLIIQGCSFRNLHPESDLSDTSKKILKTYGAIFD